MHQRPPADSQIARSRHFTATQGTRLTDRASGPALDRECSFTPADGLPGSLPAGSVSGPGCHLGRLCRQERRLIPDHEEDQGQASYLLNFEGQTTPSNPPPARGKPIRQYLRDLEDEEPVAYTGPLPRDAARAGATQNAMTRVESYDLAQLQSESSQIDGGDEDDPEAVKLWQTNHESDDPATPESIFARPYGTVSPKAGDLIEVSTDSWRMQMLAVCLGKFRGVDHYYTNTGKWFASTNVRTMFHVTSFATPAELASTIAALPSLVKEAGDSSSPDGTDGKEGGDSVSDIDKMLNTLQDMKKGPSREAGAGLLKKMQAFAHQSVSIHMAYASLLDNSYSIIRKAIFPPPPARFQHALEPVPVCWTKPFTKEESLKLYKQAYFSLDDLASILFRHQQSVFSGPQSTRINHRNVYALRNYVDKAKGRSIVPDEFTAPAMYAIYRALVSDDVAFRPVSARLGNPNETNDTVAVDTEYGDELPIRSRSCLFQVSPPEDVDMVNEVEQLVREFNDDTDNIPDNGQVRDLGDTRHRLAAFVMNAREAIDHSRKTRYWSPYGMLLTKENKFNIAGTKWTSQNAAERRAAYANAIRATGPHQRFNDDNEIAVHYPAPPKLKLERKQWNSQTLAHDDIPQSPAYNPLVREWYPYDIMVLHFMHLWAGYKRFSPSSRLHWIGSSILRATQRYEGSEYLTMSTGWTFLQEVGYLKPWDVPARYSMSLPDVPPKRDGTLDRTSRLTETFETAASEVYKAHNPADLLSEDLFEGKRQTWDHLMTYCVDSADTEDVDDGFSIEHVGDNHWVHVHIADPASCIRPGSKLAEMAKQMPQTSYLPGFTAPMFPESIVRERFSLAKGRPCLTFSALMNKNGDVLDTRITPAVLGKVTYMTPEDVSSIVAAEEKRTCESFGVPAVAQPRYADLPWTTASFAVGTPHTRQDLQLMIAKRRYMTTSDNAPFKATKELKALMKSATILRQKRLQKGAMPMYWPSPQVKVHMTYTDTIKSQSLTPSEEYHGLGSLPTSIATWKGGRSATFFRCEGDPYIKIYYDGYDDPTFQPHAAILQGKGSGRVSGAGSRMVESIMRLAGETAAKWCAERNIAVPYRGQPAAIPHLERLEVLAREVIYPELLQGKRPPEDALVEFRRLLGSDEITAVPVPHVTMGAERYTKATSPLRRYSDLVVHWQIEHALRAEMNKPGAEIDSAASVPKPLQDSDSASASGWDYWGRDPDSLRKAVKKREAQSSQDDRITGPCFTREDLERDILPLMRVRERTMRTLDNRMGRDQWMLQALVRAWKGAEYAEVIERPVFGTDRISMRRARKQIKNEEKSLRKELGVKKKKIPTPYVPPAMKKVAFRNLRFTVTGVNMRQGIVTGRLDWFERVALLEIAGLNPKNEDDDLAQDQDQDQDVDYHDDDVHETPDTKSMTPLALEDVQLGDVFPVALDFVDVHANRVVVRRTGDVCKPVEEVPAPGPVTKADKMRAKRQKAKAKSRAEAEKEKEASKKADIEAKPEPEAKAKEQ
ncbi:mitochondrial protein cyt-4 [Ophiostoma piceae UAMH 11346]|uniref:Mitochondrial protein cyt-4 n=1 Tax=Ophiostoma piceae (strain UAMH 11346) TaxID=1262450 RepID=S3CBS4_OPHP1|nr:mitochondrial protein cyt-4 [Ophiostoma piceae UAMH 11346]